MCHLRLPVGHVNPPVTQVELLMMATAQQRQILD
jgi:hypothetical protein